MDDLKSQGDLLDTIEQREQRHQSQYINEHIEDLFQEPHYY